MFTDKQQAAGKSFLLYTKLLYIPEDIWHKRNDNPVPFHLVPFLL